MVPCGCSTQDRRPGTAMNTPTAAQPDLKGLHISSDAFKLLPIDFIKRHNVLPLEIKGAKLTLFISDPSNQKVIQDIQSMTGYDLAICSASTNAIIEKI